MTQLNAEEQQVLFLIKTDADQARYFFSRAKSVKWFYPLKDLGYFHPETISYSENGIAIFWNVLDYLERVSEQVRQNPEYGKELIDIVECVVQFSRTNRRLNNYHIWWYCIKIIKNMPLQIIREYLSAQQFYVWLIVWTTHSPGAAHIINDIAENFFHKFLHDDSSAYQYAEMIIDVITQIKPCGKVRNITQREDIAITGQSYGIGEIFKHIKLFGEKCSLKTLYLLADRLNDALKFKRKNSHAFIEIEDKVYKIIVARIELMPGEIDFKEGFYNCIVKQYSQEQLESVDRKNNIYALHYMEPVNELARFEFEAIDKTMMVSSIQEMLPSEIEWTKNKNLAQKLEETFVGLHLDYSHISIKSLADSGWDHSSEAEEILILLLRDILLAKCRITSQDGLVILESFLSEKYQFPIFRRFVLLCIKEYWVEYSFLFDRILKNIPDIFEKSDFEVELYDILSQHHSKFIIDLKTKLKSLIDNVPEYYLQEGDKLSAYWKYKWFSPLRDDYYFKDFYEDAKQKAEPKNGRPYAPERSESQGGFVTHRSPILKEEILGKPITELLKYLNEFKGADFWHGAFEGEPDKEGLAEALRSAVIDDPKKFTDEINAFLDVDYFYLCRIFWGLKDSWKSGKELDWRQIFDFFEKYLERGKTKILEEASFAQGGGGEKGIYIWIIDEMVNLIHEGCKDDNRAFDPMHFASVDQIFELIFPLLKGEEDPDTQRDVLTYTLNTTLGKTIMSYVSFSLRAARATKEKPQNWGKDRYERYFFKGIEGYIWFGYYLPQMNYLDKEYTENKIECFAEKPANDLKWQRFMEGYLSGARVYGDLYPLMHENYSKALSLRDVFGADIDKRLVEHICIGYLQFDELLNPNNNDGKESLFWKTLTSAAKLDKQDRWLNVVDFFWTNTNRTIRKGKEDKEEDDLSEHNKKKMLEFWSWTFKNQEIVRENLGEKYESFLGRVAELTILLDRIDEEKEKWILLSAPYVEKEAIYFIEYLTKFEDKESIERIGRIFKKVLEHSTPEYRKEDIELIVKRIYDKGNRQDAEEICNTYGRRGVHFLKPVWEEYQKKGI